MSIYSYKLASENIRILFIHLDLLLNLVPNFANDIVLLGLLAEYKVMPGNPLSEFLPKEIFNRHKWLKIYEK